MPQRSRTAVADPLDDLLHQIDQAITPAPSAGGDIDRLLGDIDSALATPPAQTAGPRGLLSPGNIDLTNRPRVTNADGSVSTVRSIGVNVDGREVLIPTVSDDGRVLSNEAAIDAYRRTGRHLGIFDSPDASNAYAQQLHEDQARLLALNPPIVSPLSKATSIGPTNLPASAPTPPPAPQMFRPSGPGGLTMPPVAPWQPGAIPPPQDTAFGRAVDVVSGLGRRAVREVSAPPQPTAPTGPPPTVLQRLDAMRRDSEQAAVGSALSPTGVEPSQQGTAQMVRGLERAATAVPLSEESKAGVSDIVEGFFATQQPLVVGSLLAKPVMTAIALGSAVGASEAASRSVRAIGGTEESARLAGNVAALAAAGKGTDVIMRRARDVVSVAAEASRARMDARQAPTTIEPQSSDIPVQPTRPQIPATADAARSAIETPGPPAPVPTPPPAAPLPARPSVVPVTRLAPEPMRTNETPKPAMASAPDQIVEAIDEALAEPPQSDQAPPLVSPSPVAARPGEAAVGSAPPAPRPSPDVPAAAPSTDILGAIDRALTNAEKPPREFSSTQIELPPEHADAVRELAAKIPDADLAGDGREDRPHVTVKFGLHTNDVEDVRRVLANERPITVTLGKTSTFPPSAGSDGAEVVKVDVHSPDLHRLNAKIAGALAHTDTHPDYKPHVTLAYVKAGLGQKYTGDTSLEGRRLTVHDVTFSGKDRSEISIPLGSGAADTLDTGEVQPRLPGAATARQVGKADTTFKAPQQASGDDFNLAPIETPAAAARRQADENPSLLDAAPPIEPLAAATKPPATAVSKVPPTPAPARVPAPDKFGDLSVHERREVRRILKELESYQYEGRTRTVDEVGRGEQWVAGHGGAEVFHDIMDGRAGKRASVERAIAAYIGGKKPSSVASRAVEIARRRLVGDVHLSKPLLHPEAGDEPGQIYVQRRTDLPEPQQRVHDAASAALEADPQGFVSRYRERFGKVVGSDNAKELFAEYAESKDSRSSFARAMHEPTTALARTVYRQMLEETRNAGDPVVLTAGGTGSGKTSSLDLFPMLREDASVVYDSTLSSRVGAMEDIQAALDTGHDVAVIFTYRDVESAFRGVLTRAESEGRTITLGAHVGTHGRVPAVIQSLMSHYAGDDRVHFSFVDNNGAREGRTVTGPEVLDRTAYNEGDVRARLRAILEEEHAAHHISDAVYRGTLGAEAGRAHQALRPEVRSRSDAGPRGVAPESDAAGRSSKEVTTSRPRSDQGVSRETREAVGSPTRRAFSEEPPGALPSTSRSVKPSDLVKRVSALFNALPIKPRRFRERAFGIYKPKEQVIRTKVENDLATIAHELGHHIDIAIFGDNLPYGLYKDELLALGLNTSKASDSKQSKLREGAAEFFRLFVSDPVEARRQAPEYYRAFTEALDADRAWGPKVRETQQLFRDYLAQPLAQRGAARIDFTGSDAPSFLQRLSSAVKDPGAIVRAFETHWIDDLADARRVVEALQADGGTPVDYQDSAYVLARLARGAAGKASGFLHHGPRGKDGTFLAGSLESVLKPVADRLEAFSRFLVALRVRELRGRGIEAGLSAKEADAILAESVKPGYISAVRTLEATRAGEKTGLTEAQAEAAVQSQVLDGFEPFDVARRGLYAYQDAVLAYAREHGALNGDQIAGMRAVNRFYVPFQRVLDSATETLTGTARRIANRGLPVKRIKGSGKDIIAPLESVVRNTFAIVDMVEKNRAMLALVDQASEIKGSGRYIERIPDPQVATLFNLSQVSSAVRDALEEAGVDLAEVLPDGGALDLDEMVTVFTPAAFAARGANIVSVIRSGRREWYSVNDQSLYNTITAVGPQIAAWIRVLSGPASWLRAGATLTLGFIARNPARDTFTAAVQSRYGFVPVVDTVRGLYSYLKADAYYQDFLNSGAANSALVSRDRNQVRNELRKMVERQTIPRNPIELLRALSEATEMATRLGEFRKGVNAEGRTPEGMARAAMAARDVTLDFARAGDIGRQVNAFAAFFNARVQGLDRMVGLAREDVRRARDKHDPNPMHYTSGRAAVYIALISAIVWALTRDDPDYEEIPAWEKATYWHVPMPSGGWVRIPKPFEWGAIFGTTTEAALDYVKTRDPEKIRNLFPDGPGPTLRASLLSILPVAILPIVENYANYDFFRDRPIVSPYDTDLPPELQSSRWTSSTAKTLGGIIGVAPSKIDHLVYGYFAGMGGAAMATPDVLAQLSGARQVPAPTVKDVPLVGTFVRRREITSQSTSLQDLYDLSEKLKGAARGAKIYREQGRQDKIDNLLRSLGPMGKREPEIQAAVRALKELRPVIEAVYKSTTTSPTEKRRRLDFIYEQMDNIARQALGKPPLPRANPRGPTP